MSTIRKPNVLAIILAGGRGERLSPLTRERSKPAVPFGGGYRIVDFVLSNFINSEIYSIFVLVQYKSQSLIDHLTGAWRFGGLLRRQFITVVPPQMRGAEIWYQGTADAVYQNLNLIEDYAPDLVAVFGADHIYRMDINQMIQFHLVKGAEATVAALPVPIEKARGFGIIEVDDDERMVGFQEKPARPKPMPSDPNRAYSSMGNYIFNSKPLVDMLVEDAQRNTEHDFGKTIIGEMLKQYPVYAYNFLNNDVPGVRAYEERGYWRDVGDLSSYWSAHMDLLGAAPAFDLNNWHWPIRSEAVNGLPAKVLGGRIDDSLIGVGSVVRGANIQRSIIGHSVHIQEDADIQESIIMDHTTVGKGAKLRRAIIDRFNTIDAGEMVGYDPERDARHHYHVDPSGLVVRARGVTRWPSPSPQ
ncbi:MAG TPA: glucose-1-phosphate adenylyltransferase [Alphaproteobacteria bacterium]|nr:glucose-1-phosphate adenylyltransferase [Alphaproteobacteria bacterium]